MRKLSAILLDINILRLNAELTRVYSNEGNWRSKKVKFDAKRTVLMSQPHFRPYFSEKSHFCNFQCGAKNCHLTPLFSDYLNFRRINKLICVCCFFNSEITIICINIYSDRFILWQHICWSKCFHEEQGKN